MILRLLSYNIRYGGTGRELELAAVVRAAEPDLVLLQEATAPAVVARLARATGMAQWGSHPRASLGFLSRRPVAHVSWTRPRVSRHAFLEIVPAGTPWRIFGVHLSAVHAAWTERRRVYELRALLRSVARHQPGPHALIGDFNTVAPGEVLDVARLPPRLRALVWLSGGQVRWRTIAEVVGAGYVDGFRQTHPDATVSPGTTFPASDPRTRLDYVFLRPPFAERLLACDVLDGPAARVASDHRPLLAVIDL